MRKCKTKRHILESHGGTILKIQVGGKNPGASICNRTDIQLWSIHIFEPYTAIMMDKRKLHI